MLTEVADRENILVRKLCDNVFEATKKFRRDRQLMYIVGIRNDITKLVGITRQYSPKTADSLDDFVRGLDAFISAKPWPKLERFAAFYGRGTQYLSFIRR